MGEWGTDVKKRKNYDFNFNHIEEVKIYRHAVEMDSRKIKKIRKVSKKFYTYNEWKDNHVIVKYQHVTYKSLCDLKEYLKRRLENEYDKDNSISGFIYPIFIVLVTTSAGYITDTYVNVNMKLIVFFGFVIIFIYYIIKYEVFDGIAMKNMYRDYISIIQELIQRKSQD